MTQETAVLVVGAGPTGLSAAVELARRGVDLMVIDAAGQPAATSRALVVQPRTLELFDDMGLIAAALAEGRPSDMLTPLLPGHPPMRMDLSATIGPGTPLASTYPSPLMLPQDRTERLLTCRLDELGVRVRRPLRLTGLQQSGSGVQARLRGADGHEEQVSARYVIGADGAHSAVRRALGVGFSGGSYETEFLQGDVRLDWELPDGELYLMPHATGFLAAWAMPGPGRFRVFGTVDGTGNNAVDATHAGPISTTGDDVQALLDQRSPVPAKVVETTWATRYRLHHRVADRYRTGRVLLAGDAAHVHSPAGAQGMNTGIQDAYNLAWKLAGVLAGGPAVLLDSYAAERRPVGLRLLRSTDRMFTIAASRSWPARFARGEIVPRVMSRLFTHPAVRRRISAVVSQLAVGYPNSPLNCPDDRHLRGGPAPGTRAPEAPLTGAASRVHELLRGTGWTALVFGGTTSAAGAPAAARRLRDSGLNTVLISTDGAGTAHDRSALAHRAYRAADGAVYLIRPDGHVAARSAGSATDRVLRHARAMHATGGD